MSKECNEQRKSRNYCEGFPFAEQMQKMMTKKGGNCDCAQMMAMMSSCCGAQEEDESMGACSAAADSPENA